MMQNVVNKLDRGAMTGLNARPKSDISLLIRKNHDSENNRKKNNTDTANLMNYGCPMSDDVRHWSASGKLHLSISHFHTSRVPNQHVAWQEDLLPISVIKTRVF